MQQLVRELTYRDGGFAVPTVLAIIVVTLALGSVAAVAAINAQHGSVRDQDSKAAIAVADAGAGVAVMRQNTIAGSGSAACLTPGTDGLLRPVGPQPDGWCEAISGSAGGGTFSYQVRPSATGDEVEIVSVGTSDGVGRRIEVRASSSTGAGVFSVASTIGRDSITLDSNARALSGIGTNGSIMMNSNALLCGDASHGIGEGLFLETNASQGGSGCPQQTYTVSEAPLTLSPVEQGDVVTNNSNSRFFAQDVIGGRPSKVDWDPATRQLTLNSNVSLTMGGQNYSLCKLTLKSNTTLFIAAGATVRIFFDTPEACGLPSGTPQLELLSNSRMTVTSGDPTHLVLLFVGSDTSQTWVDLNSNSQVNSDCDNEFIVYAPKSDVNLDSNSVYCGAIAGKTVHMNSNAEVRPDPRTKSFIVPGAIPHFQTTRFVECTGASASPPDSGC